MAASDDLPDVILEYFAFLDTAAAQGVIRQAGFVDHRPEELPLEQQGDRLMNAISLVGVQIPGSELRRVVAELAVSGGCR